MEGKGRGRGKRLCWRCHVQCDRGSPGEEMECVDGRNLGSAVPWSGQGICRCCGQAVEGRDEEGEG